MPFESSNDGEFEKGYSPSNAEGDWPNAATASRSERRRYKQFTAVDLIDPAPHNGCPICSPSHERRFVFSERARLRPSVVSAPDRMGPSPMRLLVSEELYQPSAECPRSQAPPGCGLHWSATESLHSTRIAICPEFAWAP
jgi:hypothetical protein